MTEQLARKVFPEYFTHFNMPKEAKEQEIEVYRACRTRKLEKASFLDSYEENNFRVPLEFSEDDPMAYSMSTYQKLKDLKRFVRIRDDYKSPEGEEYPRPWALAKGHTTKEDGLSCPTKSWKKGYKGSHVDWWLYKGAQPWLAFEEVDYESEKKR